MNTHSDVAPNCNETHRCIVPVSIEFPMENAFAAMRAMDCRCGAADRHGRKLQTWSRDAEIN